MTLSLIRQGFFCLAAGRLLLGRSCVCQDYLHEVADSLALPLQHTSSSSTQAALEPPLNNSAISLLFATETSFTSKQRNSDRTLGAPLTAPTKEHFFS